MSKQKRQASMPESDVMNKVHDENIDIRARMNNYHYQHYSTFLQSKFPFLYEDFEFTKYEECSREQAKKNQLARENNLVLPVSGQSELSADDKFLVKTTDTNPKSPAGASIPDQFRAMMGNTEAGLKANYKIMSAGAKLDQKLKGARDQQSYVMRPLNEQDQLALMKYEDYIKNLVRTLYRLKGQKFGNHHTVDKVDKIFDKIQNKILIGMQDGKLKTDSYKSQVEKMQAAMHDSLAAQIEANLKDALTQKIKDEMASKIQQQLQQQGIKPPQDLELMMQKVEEEQISITQSDTVTKRSFTGSPMPRGSYRSKQIDDSPEPLYSQRRQTTRSSRMRGRKEPIPEENNCCDYEAQQQKDKEVAIQDLKQKFQLASRQFGTLHDKVFLLDGCHQTHDLQHMTKMVEDTPVYRLLEKEEITEKIMRLGLVTNPGNTVDGFCDIGGRNQGLIKKLENKLTQELNMRYQPSRQDSQCSQIQQIGSATLKSQGYQIKQGPSKKYNKQTLKLQNEIQSSLTPARLMSSDLKFFGTFNSVNTDHPSKKFDYKEKVIRDIVQKRQKKIKEIRQITGRSIASKKEPKFKIEPEIPSQKEYNGGPHRRGQSVNVSLKGYDLGKVKNEDNYYGYFQGENQDGTDYKSLEKNFKQYLRKNGALEEASLEDSALIGYDKFGRKRCKYLEDMMAQMIRPRDLHEGEYSLGEQKVMDQIKKLRYVGKKPGVISLAQLMSSDQTGSKIKYDEEVVRIDSLIESAFNSEENNKWDDYQYSKFNPSVSELSGEKFEIHSPVREDSELDDENDQFSDYNDSGSSMTSNYSDTEEPGKSFKDKIELEQAKKNLQRLQKEEEESENFDGKTTLPNIQEIQVRMATNSFIKRKMIIHEIENKQKDLSQFTFFKILKGFKFLMNRRDQKTLNTVQEIIEHSKNQMRLYKLKQMQTSNGRRKKLSLSFIDEISVLYQNEFGATPFDIENGIQVSGNLYYKKYHMSPIQINCICILIPYIVNLRHINLEECGMKDEQVSFVIQACQGLSKIKELCIGGNQIGPKSIKNFNNQNLKFRLTYLDVNNLVKTSPLYVQDLITNLKEFINLQYLNISGNKVTEKSSEILTEILEKSKTLETLVMRGCFHSYQPAKALLKSLVENQNLRSLDISESNLRHNEGDCGSHIGRILMNNTRLVHLNLNDCKLNSSEIIFIVMNLIENEHMMVVHLGYNDLDEASKNLCKILLGIETEESLIYKLNMEKQKKEFKFVNNKTCDLLISRTLKKQWMGTIQEAFSPELNDWNIQDSQPFYGAGQKAQRKIDCWICNQHNHLSIESQSLLEQHENTKEVEQLSNIFTDIKAQEIKKIEPVEKQTEGHISHSQNPKEITVNFQLKPITENLKDHNTQDSQSLTGEEAQDFTDPMLNTNILQTMNSAKQKDGVFRDYQNTKSAIEGNSSQCLTDLNASGNLNEARSHQRYKTIDQSLDQQNNGLKVSRFYNFERYQNGLNVLPISKNVKKETVKGLLESNQVYYNSNIQSKPLEAQTLQGQVSQFNEFDPEKLEEINSKLGSFQQYACDNGVMYKDIQMRTDLLHYSDSSDDQRDPMTYDYNDETFQKINEETAYRKRNTIIQTNVCDAFKSTISMKPKNQVNKKESQRNTSYGNRPKTQQGRKNFNNVEQQFNIDKLRMSHPDQKDKDSLQQSSSGHNQIQSFLNKRNNRDGAQTINTSINFKEDQMGTKNQHMFQGINEQFDDSQNSQMKELVSSGAGLSNRMPTETRASTQLNKSRMKSIPTDQSIIFRNKNNQLFQTLNPMDSNIASIKISQNFLSNNTSPPPRPTKVTDFLSINQIEKKVDKKCKQISKKKQVRPVTKQASKPKQKEETLFFDMVSGDANKVAKVVKQDHKQLNCSTRDHEDHCHHNHMIKLSPDYDHMTKVQIRQATHQPEYKQFYCLQELKKKLSFQWHLVHLQNRPIKEDVVYIIGTFTEWMPIEMDKFKPQDQVLSESDEYSPSPAIKPNQKSTGLSFMKYNQSILQDINNQKQILLQGISEINQEIEQSERKKYPKRERHFKTKLEDIKNHNFYHKSNNHIELKLNKRMYPNNILKQATDLYKHQIQLKKQRRKQLNLSSEGSNTMSDLLVDSDRQTNQGMENEIEVMLRDKQAREQERADLLHTGSMMKKQLKKDNKTLKTNKDQQSTSLVTYQKHRMNSIISQEMKKRLSQKLSNQYTDLLSSGIASLYEQKKKRMIPEDIQFVKYVAPGTHYFFFLKNGKCFVNNKFDPHQKTKHEEDYHPYDLVNYPGTSIKMNCIEVKERQTNFGITRPVQLFTQNLPFQKHKSVELSQDVKFGSQMRYNTVLGIKKYQTTNYSKKMTQKQPTEFSKMSQTLKGDKVDSIQEENDNIFEDFGI